MLRVLLAASVALVSWSAARAATPAEDAYFAAREAAVAKVKAAAQAKPAKKDAKKQEAALKQLEDQSREALLKQLSELVGPQKPQGYDKGEFSLESLQPESVGADQLDAIVYVKGEKDPSISVTTEGVAGHWLAAVAADPERANLKLPATLPEALANPTFYTLALGGEAAFSLYAPVHTTADPTAVALLGAFQQDVGPGAPNALVMSVRRGGRLYVVQAPPAKELKPSPVCEAVWNSFEQKADKAQKAYQASHEKDQAQLDASQQAEAEGDEAYRRCFAQNLKPEDVAAFAKQADQLVKLLP